jgi:hypothetical protein
LFFGHKQAGQLESQIPVSGVVDMILLRGHLRFATSIISSSYAENDSRQYI